MLDLTLIVNIINIWMEMVIVSCMIYPFLYDPYLTVDSATESTDLTVVNIVTSKSLLIPIPVNVFFMPQVSAQELSGLCSLDVMIQWGALGKVWWHGKATLGSMLRNCFWISQASVYPNPHFSLIITLAKRAFTILCTVQFRPWTCKALADT